MAVLYMSPAAMAQTSADIQQLQSEMYRYFPTSEREKFFEVTEKLKEASRMAGDDHAFYKAWGNQALYEGRNQRRSHGLQIAKQLHDYATSSNNKFGIYTGTYVSASLNKRDNDTANQVIDRILDDVALHVGDADPSDDLTLLCLKITGKPASHEKTT